MVLWCDGSELRLLQRQRAAEAPQLDNVVKRGRAQSQSDVGADRKIHGSALNTAVE